MATKKKSTDLTETRAAKPHEVMLMSAAQNAGAMEKWGGFGDVDMSALLATMTRDAVPVLNGNMKPVEAMLYGQAQALQAIFTNLARRSAMNAGQYIYATDKYMRLALKAQAQCRATSETLAIVKNPMPYIKQANIANGPQQVNNGEPSLAEKSESQQNELLEDKHGGTYLDTGATPAPARSDPEMATVAQVNRAEKRKRQS